MTKVCTKVTIVAVLVLSWSFVCHPAAVGEVIDRIVAIVNGHIILQSDWNDALRYEGVLSARSVSDFTDEDRREVLDRLIDQELLGEQMNSALIKHASEEEAAALVAQTRQLYPEAATDDGWKAVLAKFGLTEKALVSHVQQQIDLMRLVDAHLRPTIQIDSKSVETYYREKFIPQLKQSGAGEVPLQEVSAKIREMLTEEKVSELMVSWLQSLRSESKLSLPGAPEPAAADGVQTR
jgi:peptidyl-prolyl cis-trans isomerase SurA